MDYFELEAILDTLEEGTTEYQKISEEMDKILDANETALKKMYEGEDEDDEE